jgi:hypothetical protein
MRLSARMGAENEYVSSLNRELFMSIASHVERFIDDPIIGSVALALEKSIWYRMAPVALLERKRPAGSVRKRGDWYVPDGVKPLSAHKRALRIKQDEFDNTAAYLDPALWHVFSSHGGSEADALAHIMTTLKQHSVLKKAPEAIAAASSASKLKKEVDEIKKRLKPGLMIEEEWLAEQDGLIAAANARYKGKLDGLEEYQADPFTPMQEALLEEAKMLRELRLEAKTAAAKAPPVFFYGQPFDSSNAARYSKWVHLETSSPLHFMAAVMILCSLAHAMGNERTHSVAGRIMSRFRSSMTAETLERLTLAYAVFRRQLNEDPELKRLIKEDDVGGVEVYLEALFGDE